MNWYKRSNKQNNLKLVKIFKESSIEGDIYRSAQLENFFRKQASVNLYVEGYDPPTKLNTILDLCWYLHHEIFKDMKSVIGDEAYEHLLKAGFGPEFFAPDGDYWDKPIGIVNNYVKGFPPDKVSWLIKSVLAVLKKVNVRVNDVRQEPFPDSNEIRVIRYSVALNPNANEKKDIPIEINWTSGNAGAVLRLLGVEGDIWNGGNTLDAQVALDDIKRLLNEPMALEQRTEVLGMNSSLSLEGLVNLKQRLKLIEQVAKWAVDHGYKNIYFA